MSLRYEVTPGRGLLARHKDSIVWVGSDLDGEAWDALGAVLDLHPGTDPAGADTARQLDALTSTLRSHPETIFAALIVQDGRAQGVLRGPVTVCNATAVAPATGYEQFGITVPFPMSEAVFVGHGERQENPSSLALLFDLDAGVVPAGGVWAHPSGSSSRHATNVHKGANDLDTDPPIESTDEPVDAPAAAADPAGEPPPTVIPTLAEESAPDPAEGNPASIDATAQWSDPEIAMLQDGLAENGAPADPPQESAAEGRADLAADGALLGAAAANPASLPSLTASPAPWAKPDITGTQDDQGAVAGAESFEPAADHLRIDLLNVPSPDTPTPLPTIPTNATAGDRSDYPTTKPSSGVLVFDDGSTFALDQAYVLGRRPDRHELVQSGQARPLTVVDPDTVLSGAHASIRVQDGQVYLQDLGSLNGTHVAFPGETDWTRVESDQSVRLVPGTRLLFGWTVATYSGSGD